MGVKCVGYKAAEYPGQWSRMNFNMNASKGWPKSILQTSTVLQRAVPIAGKSRVMATWSDRAGKSTGEPAWIVSGYGYWMTHVLLADGDEKEKARLVAAMVGSIAPSLWNYAQARKREISDMRAMKAYAERQVKRPGEIHAVWDHSGCGLYPGNWPKTMAVLKAYGVTDVFVNVAGPDSRIIRRLFCRVRRHTSRRVISLRPVSKRAGRPISVFMRGCSVLPPRDLLRLFSIHSRSAAGGSRRSRVN
jgi:hypothetical protein